jgi:hypothetical protein
MGIRSTDPNPERGRASFARASVDDFPLLKKNELQGFKVGRGWRFPVQRIDDLRFGRGKLEPHEKPEPSVSTSQT